MVSRAAKSRPFYASAIKAPSPNTAARLPPWPTLTPSPVVGALVAALVLDEVDEAPDDDVLLAELLGVEEDEEDEVERAADVVVVMEEAPGRAAVVVGFAVK